MGSWNGMDWETVYTAALWSSATVFIASAAAAVLLLARFGLLHTFAREAARRLRLLAGKVTAAAPSGYAILAALALLAAAGLSVTVFAGEAGEAAEGTAEEAGEGAGEEAEEGTGEESEEETAAVPPVITIEMETVRTDESGLRYYRADNAGIRVRIFGSDAGEEALAWYRIRAEGPGGVLGEEAGEEALSGTAAAEWTASPEEAAALGDGRIRLFVQAENADGGLAETEEEFVMDTCPPLLRCAVKRPVQPASSTDKEKEITYYGAAPDCYADGVPGLEVRWFVEEENPDPEGILAGYTCVQPGPDGCEQSDPGADFSAAETMQAQSWQGGLVYTALLQPGTETAPDGVYRFLIGGTDLAGNPLTPAPDAAETTPGGAGLTTETPQAIDAQEGVYGTGRMVIDTAAPEAVLTVYTEEDGEETAFCRMYADGSAWENEASSFMPYRREQSAVMKVEAYDMSPTRISWEAVSTGGMEIYSSGTEDSGERYAAGAAVAAGFEGEQIFYAENIYVQDRAGNTSAVLDRTPLFYLDAHVPGVDLDVPQISLHSMTGFSGWSKEGYPLFGSGVRILVHAEDSGENVYSTGLEEVCYDLLADGEYLEQGAVLFTASEERPVCSYDGTVVVPAREQTQSNNLQLIVYARDRAGNSTDPSQGGIFPFGIDTRPPQVVVSYDNDSVLNGRYFAAPRTATIRVADDNPESGSMVIRAPGGSISPWHADAQGPDTDLVCEVLSGGDASCGLSVSGTDAAGNEAEVLYEGAAARSFVVDMTPPVMELRFAGEEEDVGQIRENGPFFTRSRTAELYIREDNFDPSGLAVDPVASSPEKTEGGYVARCVFSQDGEYRVSASCTDLAGNAAQPLASPTFVIDTTPPAVTIGGIAPAFVSGREGVFRPVIRITDDWPAWERCGAQLSRQSRESVSLEPQEEVNGQELLLKCPEPAREREQDGVWILHCTARDRAGNSTQITKRYCINRFGSEYALTKATEEALKTGYLRPGTDLELLERNVSPALERSVTLLCGGAPRELQEGTDYSVSETQEDGVYRTIYRLDGHCFDGQGEYGILVQTADEAGNRSSSAADLPLRFRVDTEAPVCRIAGIDTGRHRFMTGTLPLRVICIDDQEIGEAAVRVRDRRGKVIREEICRDKEQCTAGIPLELSSADGLQTVEAQALDGAGNRGGISYTVLVTEEYPVYVKEAVKEGARAGVTILCFFAAAAGAVLAVRNLRSRRK